MSSPLGQEGSLAAGVAAQELRFSAQLGDNPVVTINDL
jgi:hypothetical protein